MRVFEPGLYRALVTWDPQPVDAGDVITIVRFEEYEADEVWGGFINRPTYTVIASGRIIRLVIYLHEITRIGP